MNSAIIPARRGAGGPAESAAGPGARAGLAAELPLPRTLANTAHKLDDSGQLSSASATPVPACPSPGDSAGRGPSPGTYSVRGAARGGLGRRQRI